MVSRKWPKGELYLLIFISTIFTPLLGYVTSSHPEFPSGYSFSERKISGADVFRTTSSAFPSLFSEIWLRRQDGNWPVEYETESQASRVKYRKTRKNPDSVVLRPSRASLAAAYFIHQKKSIEQNQYNRLTYLASKRLVDTVTRKAYPWLSNIFERLVHFGSTHAPIYHRNPRPGHVTFLPDTELAHRTASYEAKQNIGDSFQFSHCPLHFSDTFFSREKGQQLFPTNAESVNSRSKLAYQFLNDIPQNDNEFSPVSSQKPFPSSVYNFTHRENNKNYIRFPLQTTSEIKSLAAEDVDVNFIKPTRHYNFSIFWRLTEDGEKSGNAPTITNSDVNREVKLSLENNGGSTYYASNSPLSFLLTPIPLRTLNTATRSRKRSLQFQSCNSKRLNAKLLMEFFLTGKMCGSNVVRLRFGIGKR